METIGRLVDVSVSYDTKKRRLTFEVDNCSDEEINRLHGASQLDIKAVQHRDKRSLDANAYHWKLCSLIAAELNTSLQETHKTLMLRYGTIAEIDGVAEYRIVPTSYIPADNEYWKLGGVVHLKTKDGKEVEHNLFWVVKESHKYNSKEMSSLIEGTVDEAKALGIETLTPREILLMGNEWRAML